MDESGKLVMGISDELLAILESGDILVLTTENDEGQRIGSATDLLDDSKLTRSFAVSDPILSHAIRIPQSGKFSNSFPVRWRHHAATTRVHATLDGKHTICHKPVLGPNRVKDQDNTLITCRRCIAILKTHQKHSEGLYRCIRCGVEKPHSEFYEVRSWRHSTVCKACFRKDRAESRKRLAKWIEPVGGAK